jgi:membrane protein YqaA with SNARE-associated domain
MTDVADTTHRRSLNPFKWIRMLYDRTLALSKHPKAIYWLAFISFLESSIFPIPPDVMLLPMCLANRKRALLIAVVCTLASVLGGLFGYAIGYFAFDTIGEPVLAFYGAGEKYDLFREWYEQYGTVVTFVAGLSPIPYKVITISAGVFSFPLVSFILLSILSRGLRFMIEAWIIKQFGEPAMKFIDKHFEVLTIVGGILFVGGFLAIKFLMPH